VPASTDPTPYELSRRMDDVATRLEGIVVRFETQYLRTDVFEAYKAGLRSELSSLDDRLKKVEGRQDWVVRTVGAVIVSGVLGLMFEVGHLVQK
jgi:hypothetical protein